MVSPGSLKQRQMLRVNKSGGAISARINRTSRMRASSSSSCSIKTRRRFFLLTGEQELHRGKSHPLVPQPIDQMNNDRQRNERQSGQNRAGFRKCCRIHGDTGTT